MKILCKYFGHKLYFDTANVCGSSTCIRCGHKEPPVEFDYPLMPKVKPEKKEKCESCRNGFDGTIGNGYQPCGCSKAI